jgi:integrase
VLSPEEVLQFLECVGSTKHRAILTTCYAAGLRISEAVRLKPTDVDSQRMVIRVDQGKGRKDRYVMLSPKLLDTRRSYWRAVQPKGWLFDGDVPGQPISTSAVELGCQKARRLSGIGKPHAAFDAPRVRSAFARIWNGCSHHSTAARPPQSGDHGPLPADCHEQGMLYFQSTRSATSSCLR